VRQFASSGFRIWNLGTEAKVVYTGFGVLSLLALVFSVLLYEDLVGGDKGGVATYYAGQTAKVAPVAPGSGPAGGGPKIELPDEEGRTPNKLVVAVTYRKLLEVTHFHLFTVPVFLLIIAHLFMLTGLGAGAKVAWIASGWLAAIAHLLAPWIVHYGGGSWSWLYVLSGAAMAVTQGVMTGYPIFAMWFGGK
jgi:hypothetical protein